MLLSILVWPVGGQQEEKEQGGDQPGERHQLHPVQQEQVRSSFCRLPSSLCYTVQVLKTVFWSQSRNKPKL
jgi:hypothetical protein